MMWLESKWLARGFGWFAVMLAFMAGLIWSGSVAGYITLAGTVFIIWNVVKSSINLGVLETYRKMKHRV